MLIYIIIRAQECQDVFRKNSKKICKKYQMLCGKEKLIHIYGKKGNNEKGKHRERAAGRHVERSRICNLTEKEDESMAGRSRIRTDLALEATERFQAENVEVRGVKIRERYDEEKDVRTTVVRITTENGAQDHGKTAGDLYYH